VVMAQAPASLGISSGKAAGATGLPARGALTCHRLGALPHGCADLPMITPSFCR